MKTSEKLSQMQKQMKADSESWPMTYPAWLDAAWKRWKQSKSQMGGEIYEGDYRRFGDSQADGSRSAWPEGKVSR